MHIPSILDQTDGRPDAVSGEQDAMRARLRGMWGAVAPAWDEHADFLEARHAGGTRRMLQETAPAPGERVLDLACGPGGIGLAAAELVAPGGEVVLTDVAAEMTAIAAARAAARGLRNVSTRTLDLARIDEPAGSYDVVLCREGLMFASDPAQALRDVHRVLRGGGRAGFTVWGPPADNPWLSLIFSTVSARLGRPVPPPGIPGPFSLHDGAALAGLLRDAGFADVVVHEIDVPLRTASFEEWWTRTSALAGPLAAILATLPASLTAAIVADLREATTAFATDAGLEFPGLTLLATARRAGD